MDFFFPSYLFPSTNLCYPLLLTGRGFFNFLFTRPYSFPSSGLLHLVLVGAYTHPLKCLKMNPHFVHMWVSRQIQVALRGSSSGKSFWNRIDLSPIPPDSYRVSSKFKNDRRRDSTFHVGINYYGNNHVVGSYVRRMLGTPILWVDPSVTFQKSKLRRWTKDHRESLFPFGTRSDSTFG